MQWQEYQRESTGLVGVLTLSLPGCLAMRPALPMSGTSQDAPLDPRSLQT